MDNDVFAALAAEDEALEAMLIEIDDDAATRESACPGWSISDVVLHLAQTDEMVVTAVSGGEGPSFDTGDAATIDDLMQTWIEAERGSAFESVRERWSTARRAALEALVHADPSVPLSWAAAPLKPRTLATTRLSEHWIHAQDVAGPLGMAYPDTDRLWHIARLAHRTIPYAFMRAGEPPPPEVRIELTAPAGDGWAFGDTTASLRITGSAGEFCRVAARRLDPAVATTLSTTGEGADRVLRLVRTYA